MKKIFWKLIVEFYDLLTNLIQLRSCIQQKNKPVKIYFNETVWTEGKIKQVYKHWCSISPVNLPEIKIHYYKVKRWEIKDNVIVIYL